MKTVTLNEGMIAVPVNFIPEDWGVTHILVPFNLELFAAMRELLGNALTAFNTTLGSRYTSLSDAVEVTFEKALMRDVVAAVFPPSIQADMKLTAKSKFYVPSGKNVRVRPDSIAGESASVKVFRAQQFRFFGYSSEDLGWFLSESFSEDEINTLANGELPEAFPTLID